MIDAGFNDMASTLVYDLGTTYVKVSLFDNSGNLQGLVRSRTPVRHPQPDRWEMSVDDLLHSLIEATAGVAGQVGGLEDVGHVTYATQANSFALLDSQDQPLTPLILWPDRRAEGVALPADELQRHRASTGVPEMSEYMMAAKLLWLRKNQPELVAATRRIALIDQLLTAWFTGQHVTEAGAAGITGLADIHHLQWIKTLCDIFGVPLEWLPSIVRAGASLGPVRAETADRLQIPHTATFVVGCLDQYAGAIGAGNLVPWDVSETTGTVLAVVRCSERAELVHSPEVYQGPAWRPGLYYQMAFSDVSARILEDFRATLSETLSFADLDRLAENVEPGADGLRLHPDCTARTGDDLFRDLKKEHTTGHRVRAILEGVSQELERLLALLCAENRPQVIRSAGGAAKSALWRSIKQSTLNCRFEAPDCPEPTSLGAAMLAARARSDVELIEIARRWGVRP